MTKENQLKIKNLIKSEEGKLLMEKFANVILYNSDLRNLGKKDPEVVKEAISLFTLWIEDIMGEIDLYEFNRIAEKKKADMLKESIYKNYEEV